MSGTIDAILTGYPVYGYVELLAEIAIKGTFICAAASILTKLMRNYSAYARKMIWVAAMVGILIIPGLAYLAPVWNLPILPRIGDVRVGEVLETDMENVSGKELGEANMPGAAYGVESSGSFLSGISGIHWTAFLIIGWCAGAAIAAAWYIFTVVAMNRITAASSGAGFRLESVARSIAGEMGLKKKFRLRISARVITGVTAGILNPVVILPSSSAGWSEEKLKLVLTHELAHVMRRDGIIEFLVNAAVVLHWFNPLVWLAARRIRIERERDCDNAVLNRGIKPSEYASLLMGIASDLQSRARPVLEAAMISQGSRLKDRLMCILNPSMNRSMGSCRTAVVAGLLVFTMLAPVSLSGIWQVYAEEGKDKKKKEKKLSEEEQKKLQMKKEQIKKKMMKEKYGNLSIEEKIEISWKKIVKKGGDRSAAVQFGMALKKDGQNKAEKVLKKLRKMKKKEAGKVYFDEGEFNTLGYMLLFNKRVDDAIFVFSSNADMYPESWNVYDSLGEGYLVAGKYDKAEKLYRKSLKLNPDNSNGEKMLSKIEKKRQMKMAGKK